MYQNAPRLEHPSSGTAGWTVHTAPGGARYVAPDPEPQDARIWFFTRIGGVSERPFDSLNVSARVGDDEAAVAENLARAKSAMGGQESAWVRQVAGVDVARVVEPGFAGAADALLTESAGFSLAVAVADCVPVALVGETGLGMVHSGWRGTLGGISGKAVGEMFETSARAYIGPCIRECCYEVSEELAERFAAEFGEGVVSGRNLSLPAAIREDLRRAGVEEIADLGLCTGCRRDLFYSHRKEGPRTGRNLAAVSRLTP
ncbi:MAG TPA: polyphenol oxidase family protein [Rubrobacteraceae bacterium]|nr:polyphenol oxidase family protein [Rubrobacteraceae bacterium]